MSSAATEAEILEGVERWARVRGWWMSRGELCTRDIDGVSPRGDGLPGASVRRRGWECDVYVSPALALAWALTVEADPEPVDVGRCPACDGTGHGFGTERWTSETASRALGLRVECNRSWAGERPTAYDSTGETMRELVGLRGVIVDTHPTGIFSVRLDGEAKAVSVRSYCLYPESTERREAVRCPACSGTGRETVPLARLLLDAVANAAARERVLVHADHLQAKGDPLGEAISLALGPWSKPSHEWCYAYSTGSRDFMREDGWAAGEWTWVGPVKIWPMSRPVFPGSAASVASLNAVTEKRMAANERDWGDRVADAIGRHAYGNTPAPISAAPSAPTAVVD